MQKCFMFFIIQILLVFVLIGNEGTLNVPDKNLMSILASVNSEPICLSDILPQTRRVEYQLYASYSGDKLYEEIKKIRLKAVNELINQKLAIEDYKSQDFKIPEDMVESEIDKMAERMGCRSRNELIDQLRKSKTSLKEVKEEIRNNIIVQVMSYQQFNIEVNITPKDVYDYYKKSVEAEKKESFVELALILIDKNRENYQEIIDEISKKLTNDVGTFATLATKYSSGPAAINGGKLGKIDVSKLRNEFKSAIKEFKIDNFYGPIKTADGTAFIKILDFYTNDTSDFKSSSEKIRQKLENDARSKVNEKYFNKLRENAIVRYFF